MPNRSPPIAEMRYTSSGFHLPNQGTSCLLDFVPDERGLCSIPPQPSAIVPRRFTILEQILWSALGQFERRHSREISTDSATEQKAMKVIAAFAAWEYSHCVLSTSQFAGTIDQLLVALFAGYVHIKK